MSAENQALTTYLPPDAPNQVLARRYLDALLVGDRAAASRLIMESFESGQLTVQEIYLDVFQACQREVGRLWQTGDISVAQEHFCTAVTQLCMSQLYPFIFTTEKNGFKSVIACAQGELHEVGVRMVADMLEMNGWDTHYLGANVPVDSIVEYIQKKQPHLVGLSATISAHLPQVKSLIQRLRRLPGRPLRILVGGFPFNADSELWRAFGADAFAPDAMTALEAANRLVETERDGQ